MIGWFSEQFILSGSRKEECFSEEEWRIEIIWWLYDSMCYGIAGLSMGTELELELIRS